jgi:hypothetical protein
VPKFALMGFDACLMGNWETLVALNSLTDYVLASEELEPGHGWDWRAWRALAQQQPVSACLLAAEVAAAHNVC